MGGTPFKAPTKESLVLGKKLRRKKESLVKKSCKEPDLVTIPAGNQVISRRIWTVKKKQ